MTPWHVIEHTADVGLRATGATLEQAIADLVAGFGRLVCPEGEVATGQVRIVEVVGADLSELVIDLLDDVNFLVQTEGFLPARATITLAEDRQHLRAEVAGETYDRGRHGHMMEIKATTYHGLKVEETPAVVEVIFDI